MTRVVGTDFHQEDKLKTTMDISKGCLKPPQHLMNKFNKNGLSLKRVQPFMDVFSHLSSNQFKLDLGHFGGNQTFDEQNKNRLSLKRVHGCFLTLV